jgi:hypothetical protein
MAKCRDHFEALTMEEVMLDFTYHDRQTKTGYLLYQGGA